MKQLGTILLFLIIKISDSRSQNICGIWESNEYQCPGGNFPYETFAVRIDDGYATATKITGDDCVTSGQITWQGDYHPPQFPVTMLLGNQSNPNCCFATAMITVINEWHMELRFGNGGAPLNFWRPDCEKLDSLNLHFRDYNLPCDCHAGGGHVILSPSVSTGNYIVLNNTNSDILEIIIYNTVGQSVYRTSDFPKEIDLGGLRRGLYLFAAKTKEDKIYNGKIIKN
jgi:hypothetical protein